MKLHERLQELRHERGWSQKTVTAQAELSASFVCSLESGESLPSLTTLQVLARVYGLSVHALLAPVDFMGDSTPGGLPAGVRALEADPEFGAELDDDWLTLLGRIEHQGRRLKTRREALEVYLHLQRIFGQAA